MNVDPAGRCESARDLAGDRPPTDDDLSITRDGCRLDTPAKVIAFLDDIVASKEFAGSDKDNEALPELNELLRRQRRS